jgi:hypothetical protein
VLQTVNTNLKPTLASLVHQIHIDMIIFKDKVERGTKTKLFFQVCHSANKALTDIGFHVMS